MNNDFPAYAAFNRKKSNRYVFEQYESTRGPTLFQPKDRLFLTRSIMLRCARSAGAAAVAAHTRVAGG